MSRIKTNDNFRKKIRRNLPTVGQTTTVLSAQYELVDHIREGSECLCCGQFVKVYSRLLNANMSAFLISLYKEHNCTRDWVHHSDCFHKGRDYPYVALWGLAKRKPNDDSSKRTSGFWKTTKLGRAFVNHQEFVPAHAFVYNNHVVGWSSVSVDIVNTLGKRFNYQELMRS